MLLFDIRFGMNTLHVIKHIHTLEIVAVRMTARSRMSEDPDEQDTADNSLSLKKARVGRVVFFGMGSTCQISCWQS